MSGKFRAAIRLMRRCQSGTVTIEAAIWLPALLLMMVAAIDTTMVFAHRAQALRIAQDGSRGLAVFRLANEAAVTNYVLTRVHRFAPSATAITVTDPVKKILVTQVDIPLSEMDMMGTYSVFGGYQVTVVAHQMRESW